MNRFFKGRHRRDANHKEIAEALERLGCSVRDTSQCGDNGPDLSVGLCGSDYGVEIKSAGEGLTAKQSDWHNAWRGSRPVVLWTVDQAHAWVNGVRRRVRGFPRD